MATLDMPFGEDRPGPTDRRILDRYRYLLRIAPPEAIEQAHAEAFAQLTPEQRAEVLHRLAHDLPMAELPSKSDVQSLARAATRAELHRPGVIEKCLGAASVGQMFGSSLLVTVVAAFVGSEIAQDYLGGFESSNEANRIKDSMISDPEDRGSLGGDVEEQAGFNLGETEPD